MLEGFMTKRHFGLLHVARQRLGLADDDWRALLGRVAGVASSRDLTPYTFQLVMEELGRLGFKSDWSKATFGGVRYGMASPGQLALIRQLWADFTDRAGDDASLGRFMSRKGWPSHLRFLDGETARKVIGALRSMTKKKRPRGPAEGPPAAA